jgi:hypothetical protein
MYQGYLNKADLEVRAYEFEKSGKYSELIRWVKERQVTDN